MKLPPPAFMPLEDLARCWRCSVELLLAYSDRGTADGRKLAITELCLGGVQVRGVKKEDLDEFTGSRASKETAQAINGNERASLLAFVGMMLVTLVKREDLAKPYSVARQIEQDAAVMGAGGLITDDTMAAIVRKALAELTRRGADGAVPKSERGGGSDAIPPENPSVGRRSEGSGNHAPAGGTV